MKTVFYALLLIGLIGYGGYKLIDKHQSARAEISRQYLLDQEKKRLADEKREREIKEAEEKELAKSKALQLLRSYLERQEKALKDTIEKHTAEAGLVRLDQEKLSTTLANLEKVADQKAVEARKRKKERYDKADRVLEILQSPEINELALKYKGEDLNAMLSEYKSRMQTVIGLEKETSKRLSSIRGAYKTEVAGIDEEVDEKNAVAARAGRVAEYDLKKNIAIQEKQREKLTRELSSIQQRRMNRSNNEAIAALKTQIAVVEQEISRLNQVLAVSKANIAQNEAATLETSARRRYDAAEKTARQAESDVHAEMAHRRTVFNLAIEYENRSLDAIRNAMMTDLKVHATMASEAQKKLDYITKMSANMDFLGPADIENMKKKIAEKMQEKVIAVED